VFYTQPHLDIHERTGGEMMPGTYFKAICMGVVAGMRSMSAPAFTSDYLVRQNSETLANSPFGLMGSTRAANVLKVAAMGELVFDKLPGVPARVSTGPLVARILSGALCGASLCTVEGKRVESGAIAGGLAAIGSAYAFYHLRREIGEGTNVPDAVLGLAEDAIVIGSALSVLHQR
jgi:uncharacterized membrane protein